MRELSEAGAELSHQASSMPVRMCWYHWVCGMVQAGMDSAYRVVPMLATSQTGIYHVLTSNQRSRKPYCLQGGGSSE